MLPSRRSSRNPGSIRLPHLAHELLAMSVAPAPVDGVELALPRLEVELAELGGEHEVAVALVHRDHLWRDGDRLAESAGLDLDLAGALQHVVVEEHRRQ